ncbi:MAG: hypothetical protein JWO67_747 [Streptosporangiaceae bacterium]|nr:hypothetical protein [Streptosporangiaceae bacterium]
MEAGHVYHWKHGWIPLDHAAALSKAKGSHTGAERIMAMHGIAHQNITRHPGGSGYFTIKDSNSSQQTMVHGVTLASLEKSGHSISAVTSKDSFTTIGPRGVMVRRNSSGREISTGPGEPGVMDEASYKQFSENVKAQRLAHQPAMDATAATLPEAQARQLLGKYAEIVKKHSIGIGEYGSRPHPTEDQIKALGHADAAARALRDRLAVFDQERAVARGKQPATEAQIAHIQRLLLRRQRSGEGGGFATVKGDIGTLTKAQASAYISSLSGEY